MNTHLTIPQSAVAAAGRALKFTIAELTDANRRAPNPMLENEIMEMMDANKAMFSAVPPTEVAELQARLIERTEASTATAYRDAETIRKLRSALQAMVPSHSALCAAYGPVTQDSCKCRTEVKAARIALGEWKEGA